MGVINHNAVLATTWSETLADELQAWVDQLSEGEQNLFVRSSPVTNGYHSFALMPDGSKEGWEESDSGDLLRQRFIDRLSEDQYDDASSPWDWVEVGFGEYGQKVLKGNCKNRYTDAEYAE